MGPIDLRSFDAPLETVIVRSGPGKDAPAREIGVRAVDGYTYRALQLMQEAKESFDRAMKSATPPTEVPEALRHSTFIGLVRRCIPDATDDEVDTLTPIECGVILRIAQGRLTDLLAEVREADRGKLQGREPAPLLETPSPIPVSG